MEREQSGLTASSLALLTLSSALWNIQIGVAASRSTARDGRVPVRPYAAKTHAANLVVVLVGRWPRGVEEARHETNYLLCPPYPPSCCGKLHPNSCAISCESGRGWSVTSRP